MIELSIESSVDQLPDSWDDLVAHDIMLQRNYLSALEKACPSNISLYFMVITKDGELIAVSVVQHVKLYLQDIFRKNTGNYLVRTFRKIVSSFLKGHILVLGNLTHTGQHGIFFNPDRIDNNRLMDQVFLGLKEISNHISRTERRVIRLFLFKDYFIDRPLIKNGKILLNNRLYRVKVQPNMVLDINRKWHSIDDYYSDLNKKYQRRFRSARKKLGDIAEIELDLEDIQNWDDQLNQLYLNVSENAKLNMFLLPKNHFYEYKRIMGLNFRVFGFFKDGELVGFYSLILNNKKLETYFLGYDTDYQYKNQLYLNMLYNMLDFAITNDFEKIIYARTAMEIKSSVGAEPKDMIMYIKHTNAMLNRLLKPVFDLLDPTETWQERHPFS